MGRGAPSPRKSAHRRTAGTGRTRGHAVRGHRPALTRLQLHGEYDLAEEVVALHQLVSVADLRERKCRGNSRHHVAGRNK